MEAVESETSGDFRRLLVSQLTGNRKESVDVDREAAIKDARELYDVRVRRSTFRLTNSWSLAEK